MMNNSLLVWWLLSGGDLDKLPVAGPHPEPWREQLLASLAILEISARLPGVEVRRELRRTSIEQMHAALDAIPSDEPHSPGGPRTQK
jgi:hypothetical protein